MFLCLNLWDIRKTGWIKKNTTLLPLLRQTASFAPFRKSIRENVLTQIAAFKLFVYLRHEIIVFEVAFAFFYLRSVI